MAKFMVRSYPIINMERRDNPFDPVHIPYGQVLMYLIQNSLVDPKKFKPLPSSLSHGYDPIVKCGYHARSVGHSVEDYGAFMAVVQKLIDDNSLVFKEDHPKVKCEYHNGTI